MNAVSTNPGISSMYLVDQFDFKQSCIRRYSLGKVGLGGMSKTITNVNSLTNRCKTRK